MGDVAESERTGRRSGDGGSRHVLVGLADESHVRCV